MNTSTPRARAMRKSLTPPEARLWRELKRWRSEGFRFRRQAPFRGYFLDFACFNHRLAVEVDGAQHWSPDAIRHDAVRDAVLAEEGFLTLRVPAVDVLGNMDGVVRLIREALAHRNPTRPSGQSPQKGPRPSASRPPSP